MFQTMQTKDVNKIRNRLFFNEILLNVDPFEMIDRLQSNRMHHEKPRLMSK